MSPIGRGRGGIAKTSGGQVGWIPFYILYETFDTWGDLVPQNSADGKETWGLSGGRGYLRNTGTGQSTFTLWPSGLFTGLTADWSMDLDVVDDSPTNAASNNYHCLWMWIRMKDSGGSDLSYCRYNVRTHGNKYQLETNGPLIGSVITSDIASPLRGTIRVRKEANKLSCQYNMGAGWVTLRSVTNGSLVGAYPSQLGLAGFSWSPVPAATHTWYFDNLRLYRIPA